MTDYRRVSLWFDGLPSAVRPRRALAGDADADVCVVGAGLTGLWAAYYLSRLDPALRITVVESEVAGFGASGRNGGWCSALFPVSWTRVAKRYGAAAATAFAGALRDTVEEVRRVTDAAGINADYHRGGTLVLARSTAQQARLRARLDEERRWDPDAEWLSAQDARSRIAATSVLGAAYTPHCAALNPTRLVRGLADVVVRQGVTLYERTPALHIGPRRVQTAAGVVTADVVIRATEGYTPGLRGSHRALAPVYSLMIATEPLPAAFWDAVGWRSRETLGDGRHLLIYAQRTADDRIAFGGRGAPYHFGSRISPAYDREPAVFDALRRALVDLFPAARDAAITHRWGGPLGVPRDWFPSVGLDRANGLGWAGGYVGDGVAATNLAGRTLADLVAGRDTELTRLPWVGHRSPNWEPEPLRWLGVNAMRRVIASSDAAELRTGRPAQRAALVETVLGG